MKTTISNTQGVVTEREGDGFFFDRVWSDMQATIHQGTGAAALTYEVYRDTGFFMNFYRYTQDDYTFMSFELPREWDDTTTVKPHIHYIPMASGSGDIKFNYAYNWVYPSGTLPAIASWTTGSVTVATTPAEQYVHKIASFGSVTIASSSISNAILLFKVSRNGLSDAADTYHTTKDHETASANVGLLFFDINFQIARLGTTDERNGY